MKLTTKNIQKYIFLFCCIVQPTQAATVIDIRPITMAPNGANTSGLAYNSDTDTLVFSQSIVNPTTFLTEEARMYTIDTSGNLVSSWDLRSHLPTTNRANYIQYNSTTGNLEFSALGPSGYGIYETSPDGSSFFGKTSDAGGKRFNGNLWNTNFSTDEVLLYDTSGTTLIDTFDVSSFIVNSSSGPADITSSLAGDVMVADFFGSALFEMDSAGNGIRYIPLDSFSPFGAGSRAIPNGVTTDHVNGRIFVEIEGDFIVVLDATDLNNLTTSFPTQPPASSVPLPSTIWLLASGLIWLAGYARKR